MDYKVLIYKFYHGETSCEEEEMLRRYLMGDDLPADVQQDKELLLAMLQQAEYDCKEAMDGISAMIDELAVQDDGATRSLQPASQRAWFRYLYSALSVAAVLAMLYLLFPYSNKPVDTSEKSLLAHVGAEEHSSAEVILPNIVEANESSSVVNDTKATSAPMVIMEHDEKPVAIATKGKNVSLNIDKAPVYIASLQSDEQEMDKTLSHAIGGSLKEFSLRGTRSEYSGYLCENEIIIVSETEGLRNYQDEEYRAKLQEIAKANEAECSGSPFPPHIESLLLAKYGSKEISEGQILAAGNVKFASEDAPWNPAFPLKVYDIHDEGNETIITFLFSVCYNSQCIAFSKGIYAQDLESGDTYNVLGYTDGLEMSRLLVVNGCIGKNVLVSLRFPKFNREVRTITIYNPGHADDIKTIDGNDNSLKVLAEKVDVRNMRMLHKQRH